jgi:hypothetical protein
VPVQDGQVVLWGEALGLARLRLQVQRHHDAGRSTHQRRSELRDQYVREHRGVPGARTQNDPLRLADRLHRLGARCRVRRLQADIEHLPGRRRYLDLATDDGDIRGVVRVCTADISGDVQWRHCHRKHPSPRSE